MAMDSAVGSFNTGTGAIGTTVVVSGLSFAPVVVFFWWNGRTETIDASGRRTATRGFSAASSTTSRRRVNTLAQDTPTTMVTNRSQDDTEVVAISTTSSTVDGLLDVQSFDSGGFTLVVDDQFTADYRVQFLALGGSDITDVNIDHFTKNTTTGNQDITSLSFEPDLVLMFSSGQTTMGGTIAADSRFCIGAIDSAGRQAVYAGGSNNNAGNAQTLSYCTDLECFAQYDAAITSVVDRASYVSMLSNGFRINWDENTGATADLIIFVALKGGNYRVDSLLTQTDTTTDIVKSGFGFTPVSALFVSHAKAESTINTAQDDDDWSTGAFSSTSLRVAMATSDDDAAATAIVSSATEHDEVYINLNANTGAVEGLMDIKSIDSDGFTLIMDDADPSQAFVWFIAFGSASSGTDTPMSVNVTVNYTFIIRKDIGKITSASISASSLITKNIMKPIPLIQNINILVSKGIGMIIYNNISTAIQRIIDISKTTSITQTIDVTVAKSFTLLISYSVASIVSIRKSIAIAKNVVITSSLSIQKHIAMTKSIVIAIVLSIGKTIQNQASNVFLSRNVRSLMLTLKNTAIGIVGRNSRTIQIHLKDTDNDD